MLKLCQIMTSGVRLLLQYLYQDIVILNISTLLRMKLAILIVPFLLMLNFPAILMMSIQEIGDINPEPTPLTKADWEIDFHLILKK